MRVVRSWSRDGELFTIFDHPRSTDRNHRTALSPSALPFKSQPGVVRVASTHPLPHLNHMTQCIGTLATSLPTLKASGPNAGCQQEHSLSLLAATTSATASTRSSRLATVGPCSSSALSCPHARRTGDLRRPPISPARDADRASGARASVRRRICAGL